MPFQPGRQKIQNAFGKRYHPFLYRMGARRYACRGRKHFRTATEAHEYAQKWAVRAFMFLNKQESNHVD